MDLHLQVVYGLAEALDFFFELLVLQLVLVGRQHFLLSDQIVQLLLSQVFLRLHHVHLCILLVQLHFNGRVLSLVLQFPRLLFLEARVTVGLLLHGLVLPRISRSKRRLTAVNVTLGQLMVLLDDVRGRQCAVATWLQEDGAAWDNLHGLVLATVMADKASMRWPGVGHCHVVHH